MTQCKRSHYLLIKGEKGNIIKHLPLTLREKNAFILNGHSLLDSSRTFELRGGESCILNNHRESEHRKAIKEFQVSCLTSETKVASYNRNT